MSGITWNVNFDIPQSECVRNNQNLSSLNSLLLLFGGAAFLFSARQALWLLRECDQQNGMQQRSRLQAVSHQLCTYFCGPSLYTLDRFGVSLVCLLCYASLRCVYCVVEYFGVSPCMPNLAWGFIKDLPTAFLLQLVTAFITESIIFASDLEFAAHKPEIEAQDHNVDQYNRSVGWVRHLVRAANCLAVPVIVCFCIFKSQFDSKAWLCMQAKKVAMKDEGGVMAERAAATMVFCADAQFNNMCTDTAGTAEGFSCEWFANDALSQFVVGASLLLAIKVAWAIKETGAGMLEANPVLYLVAGGVTAYLAQHYVSASAGNAGKREDFFFIRAVESIMCLLMLFYLKDTFENVVIVLAT